MTKFKVTFISIGSALSSFLGVLFIPIIITVICNTIDFITGIAAAWMRGEKITSGVFYKGIVKKVGMWILIVVGVLIDETLAYSVEQFGITMPLSFLIACIVSVWLICNELLSIVENLDEMEVPMPAFLKKLIRRLQQQTENKVIIPDLDDETKEGV